MEIIRRCWAEISLDALRSNLEKIKSTVGTEVMCVIKANAYGHGDTVVERELERLGVRSFAVASVDEAVHLRQNGASGELVVLGACLSDCFSAAAENDVSLAVCDMNFAERLSAFGVSAGRKMKAHVKLNTGMNRVGFDMDCAVEAVASICAMDGIDVQGVFTHFAVSDEPDGVEYTNLQLERFLSVRKAIESMGINAGKWHCANSGAILNRPDCRLDMVRAGLVLYGCYDGYGAVGGYTPLLTLKTVITQLRSLPAGVSVSYGRTFFSETPRRIAVVSIGYGDGYPRSLSNRGYMMVNGKAAPVAGRVCMDQTMIDVTDIPCAVGDEVTVIGDGVSASDIAATDGTINYEILCAVAQRVPRLYFKDGKCVNVEKYL